MTDLTSASRRAFLQRTVTATGFTLGLSLLPGTHAMAALTSTQTTASLPLQPSVFIGFEADGQVVITCHRSEMGQQIRTSIAQIVAEELKADWQRVTVQQGTGDKKYGDQNTDGSRSVRRNFTRLREAGALAALLMKQAAAKVWMVKVEDCQSYHHKVIHTPSGKQIDYAQLVPIAAGLDMPSRETVTLTPRPDWQLIGQPKPSVDLPAVLAGTAIYGQDVQLENMVYAVIQRPPVLFGGVKALNSEKTKAMAGVIDVITMPEASAPAAFNPLGGVAVIANNTWTAMQGCDALEIEWQESEHDHYDSSTYRQQLEQTAKAQGEIIRHTGDIKQGFDAAHRKMSATYYAPHLAQAPMEPPAATARIQNGKVEVWTCTQTPQASRREVAKALGVDESDVTINVTFLGGGFGRKSKPDYVVEAALLAQQTQRPVKVIWRREDDIQNGYVHSVSAQYLQAGVNHEGKVTTWRQNTVFPSISSTFDPSVNTASDNELGLGFIDNPFAIENMQLERGIAKNHVRIGWLRSVCNIYHAFATQSFANELAVASDLDHKTFLLNLIGPDRHIDLSKQDANYVNYGDPIDVYPLDTGRLKNVIRRATALADWDNHKQQGRFLGLAAHRSFLTYVATVVEVEVDNSGSWSIKEVYSSIDAGTVVNPEHVTAQCEGGAIFGLSCALGELTAAKGKIEQSNFHNYQVARMQQAPDKITIDIVKSDAPPAGVGEPPTPPFIPALTNALYAATGKRIRALPIPLTIA
jgi:isoquinoline 1-oxidoreductase beta subunit